MTDLGKKVIDIYQLPEENVSDVSYIDTTGKGVRNMRTPKTKRGGKIETQNHPIISNNIDNYIQALRIMYGPNADEIFVNDIEAVRAALISWYK